MPQSGVVTIQLNNLALPKFRDSLIGLEASQRLSITLFTLLCESSLLILFADSLTVILSV